MRYMYCLRYTTVRSLLCMWRVPQYTHIFTWC